MCGSFFFTSRIVIIFYRADKEFYDGAMCLNCHFPCVKICVRLSEVCLHQCVVIFWQMVGVLCEIWGESNSFPQI